MVAFIDVCDEAQLHELICDNGAICSGEPTQPRMPVMHDERIIPMVGLAIGAGTF
jgi:hypothetical protein